MIHGKCDKHQHLAFMKMMAGDEPLTNEIQATSDTYRKKIPKN